MKAFIRDPLMNWKFLYASDLLAKGYTSMALNLPLTYSETQPVLI